MNCKKVTRQYTKNALFAISVADEHKTYFVNFRVNNKAGKKTLIFSSDQNPKSGFLVNSGATMQITKEVASEEPISFYARGPEGKKPILLNSLRKLFMTPTANKANLNTNVDLTVPG